MKKILSMLCIFALVTFVFAGCSHNKETTETNPGETGTTAGAGTEGTTGETGTVGTTGETGTAGTEQPGATGTTGTEQPGATGTMGTEQPGATTPGTETGTPGTEQPGATGTIGTGSTGTTGTYSGTTGATPDDATIESEIRQNLQQQNINISNVSITVNAGVVTLSGQVASEDEANRIVSAVRSVANVKQVNNNLTVGQR